LIAAGTSAATAASAAGTAELVAALDVVAELELAPPALADDDEVDELLLPLLPHPAIAATQSSATAAASQLLLIRIATPSSLDHPEPGRRISNKSFAGAKL
jgi:hypothetical protein